jgi:hypothetical protein
LGRERKYIQICDRKKIKSRQQERKEVRAATSQRKIHGRGVTFRGKYVTKITETQRRNKGTVA